MAADVPVRCACGTLKGTVHDLSPKAGNHVICYCDDCQAFARALGRADIVLDDHGGTDIFQTSPARVTFDRGTDRLACLRLTPKGLLRWYAACCDTPVGNTLPTASLPFVGLVCACLGDPADGATRAAVLGPVKAHVHRRFAFADAGAIAPTSIGFLGAALRFARLALGGRMRGEHKRTPFFDTETGRPVGEPRVLTESEREAALQPF